MNRALSCTVRNLEVSPSPTWKRPRSPPTPTHQARQDGEEEEELRLELVLVLRPDVRGRQGYVEASAREGQNTLTQLRHSLAAAPEGEALQVRIEHLDRHLRKLTRPCPRCRCPHCPRRLNTAGGLSVHIDQVHKLGTDK